MHYRVLLATVVPQIRRSKNVEYHLQIDLSLLTFDLNLFYTCPIVYNRVHICMQSSVQYLISN